MNTRQLIIDGMLSGTGIRDGINGGYVEPVDIGLSKKLQARILKWLRNYENAHYFQFNDNNQNMELDLEGIEIARLIRAELPEKLVTYFSNAQMKEIDFK